MNLVEKHIIKRTGRRYKELLELCHLSKNLYNAALYIIRQHWFETKDDDTVEKKFLNYYDVWNLMKKDNPDFKALNSHSSQLVLKQVETEFSSFFSLLKLKSKGRYDKKVKLPGYLPKDGYNVVSFNQFKAKELKDGYVTLPRSKTLRFKVKNRNVHYINVVPRHDHVVVMFVYRKQEPEVKPDNGRYMAVDLGVDNLATVTSNVARAFIVDGKKVKFINRNFNKDLAKARSELETKTGRKHSHRTRRITQKRNNRIEDYFHKTSRYLINQAVSKGVRTIIVGHNKNWKQEVDLGRKNNQKFVQIPFDRLIRQLKYKGRMEGISVVEIEEGYTSKCSFLDSEKIGKHDSYAGRRTKRGLFVSGDGTRINSDVNGSYNIMRKYLKCDRDAVRPADVGFVYNPVKVRL